MASSDQLQPQEEEDPKVPLSPHKAPQSLQVEQVDDGTARTAVAAATEQDQQPQRSMCQYVQQVLWRKPFTFQRLQRPAPCKVIWQAETTHWLA